MGPKNKERVTHFEKTKIDALAATVWVMSRHRSCQCHGLQLISRHQKKCLTLPSFSDESMS